MPRGPPRRCGPRAPTWPPRSESCVRCCDSRRRSPSSFAGRSISRSPLRSSSFVPPVDQRPDFTALAAEGREADAQAQLGRALRRPDLGVRVSYEREERDTIVLGGLSVTLPAFQRGQGTLAAGRRARVASARRARNGACGRDLRARDGVRPVSAARHAGRGARARRAGERAGQREPRPPQLRRRRDESDGLAADSARRARHADGRRRTAARGGAQPLAR